jgi:predicted dehydrogenase
MVRLARTKGRHLGVGFQLRHNRVAMEARRLVMAGAIGKVLYAMAQFNLTSSPPPRLSIPHAPWKGDPVQMGGAGALMGLGVHIIDLLRFLVGQEVCMVQASASGVTADQPLETFGQVLLEFDGEAHGHITYGGSFPLSRNDAVLYGSGGRLIADGVVDVASRGALHLTAPDTATGTRTESWNPEPADHYRCEFEAFSRAIVTGAPFTASGVDGLRAVEATDAIIQSQQLGRRIPVTRVTA